VRIVPPPTGNPSDAAASTKERKGAKGKERKEVHHWEEGKETPDLEEPKEIQLRENSQSVLEDDHPSEGMSNLLQSLKP